MARATSRAADTSNLLKPAPARGEPKTIAATTERIQKYFEKDAAPVAPFSTGESHEPNAAEANYYSAACRRCMRAVPRRAD
ncbi:hypothetical protein KCP69_18465 [Salmonella enterica subsp. enterica]|nr:hypothetical protein KCP69_18465 [Salmonella enterica subsp. enterica]